MRITYRGHGGNRAYWQSRWDNLEADAGELNVNRYPGKYVEETLSLALPADHVLEAGCGTGRVALYCHQRGHKVVGMDFIASALVSIRRQEFGLPLVTADITHLPFVTSSFSVVLAFGLYHNLETGFEKAIEETRRVLKKGGMLCASIRLDNFQNRVIDCLADRKKSPGPKNFYKLNLSRREIEKQFTSLRFDILKIDYVENMPFLYKFGIFRHPTHRVFNEKKARAEGYRLSPLACNRC